MCNLTEGSKMKYKKLLIAVRYRKGEITAMTRLSIRDSALAGDKEELVLPGDFSLARSPDTAAMLDITPELVASIRAFADTLELAVKDAEKAEKDRLKAIAAEEKAAKEKEAAEEAKKGGDE